jgi:hypothetical protein
MRRFIFLLFLLISFGVRAAVPTFESFSTDQFQTNNLRLFYRDPHTNDNGIIYPALVNTLTIVTNENIYGTFSLPSKVTLLSLGTNYLDVSTNTTWLLNSPTNDATQVILSLSAGAYQGQLLFVTSQNGSNAFTLPDLSEQWDVPGAYVDIQGDWIGTTNRGMILQYTAPDWIEMARFDPGQTGGGTVLGGGTPGFLTYWVNASTLGNSPLQRFSADTIQLVNGGNTLQFGVSSGVSFFSGTSAIEFIAGAGVLVMNGGQYLTPSTGGVGMTLGTGTNYFGGLILGTNGLFGVYTDDGSQLLRNGVPFSGGAALWASGGGVLSPSPAVDVVSITSQLADNATNVALIVDTANVWADPGSYQFKVGNAGTNFFNLGSIADLTGVYTRLSLGDKNQLTETIKLDTTTTPGSGNSRLIVESTRDGFNQFEAFSDIIADGSGSSVFRLFSTENGYTNYMRALLSSSLGQLTFELSDEGDASAIYTRLQPTVASTGSATAYLFDTANLLQSGDLVADFANAGTNVLSIDSGGGILSGRGNTTIDEAYSFRSSHNQALGENQFNTVYIEDTTSGNYTNWASINLSTLANGGSPATASNFLMDSATATKAAEFEVALVSNSTSSTNSFIKLKEDTLVKFQVDYRGILTSAPPTDTAQFWQFGSEAVISTVTNLIVSVNGVKYSFVATPR